MHLAILIDANRKKIITNYLEEWVLFWFGFCTLHFNGLLTQYDLPIFGHCMCVTLIKAKCERRYQIMTTFTSRPTKLSLTCKKVVFKPQIGLNHSSLSVMPYVYTGCHASFLKGEREKKLKAIFGGLLFLLLSRRNRYFQTYSLPQEDEYNDMGYT